MIQTPEEYQLALERMHAYELALEALREELEEQNPALLAVAAKGYQARIASLRDEAFSYLRSPSAKTSVLMSASGEVVGLGTVPARYLAGLLERFQSAVEAAGTWLTEVRKEFELPRGASLRNILRLNAVAAGSGSFTLGLEFEPLQLPLFPSSDLCHASITLILDYFDGLQQEREDQLSSKLLLRRIEKLAELLGDKKIRDLRITHTRREQSRTAVLTLKGGERARELLGRPHAGERSITGRLYEINLDDDTFTLETVEHGSIHCTYSEEIEDDLLSAMKKSIMATGTLVTPQTGQKFRLQGVEDFKVLEEPD